MNYSVWILNTIVCIALIILTGNLFLGIIGAYGFHKGRIKYQKRNEKKDMTDE